ncbi:hypothetical protein [Ethanoligenens sp.]|uniref:hypothetical protein n=1 Tax=Ethanoligenens sp. TaxID=2099655 RepID=UPI0039E89C1D
MLIHKVLRGQSDHGQKGSSLLLVMVFFAFFMVMAMAVFSLACASTTVSTVENRSQQAYFTARSANGAATKLAQQAAVTTATSGSLYNLQQALIGVLNGSRLSYTLMGSAANGLGNYSVVFTKNTDGTLKLTATNIPSAKFAINQQRAQVTANLNWTASSVTQGENYANPFQNVRYISGAAGYDAPHFASGATFTGQSTYYDVTTLNNMTINGDLIGIANPNRAQGNGGSWQNSNLYLAGHYNSQGNLHNISTTGNLYIGTRYYFNGWQSNGDDFYKYYADSVYVNGNLTVDVGQTLYVNHLYVTGTITIKGSIQRLSPNQPITQSDGKANFSVTYPGNMPMQIGYNNGTNDPYYSNSLAYKRTENDSDILSLEKNGTVATTSSSGLLTQDMVNSLHNYTVNTGSSKGSPMRLLLAPSVGSNKFTISCNITVSGSNYLYIYIPDDATYKVNQIVQSGSITWTNASASNPPKILIIEGHQTYDPTATYANMWYLDTYAVLQAYLYTPSFQWTSTSGTTWSSAGFYGSALITTSTVQLSSQPVFAYCPPLIDSITGKMFAGTPLENIASGNYSTQFGNSAIAGWSNK